MIAGLLTISVALNVALVVAYVTLFRSVRPALAEVRERVTDYEARHAVAHQRLDDLERRALP